MDLSQINAENSKQCGPDIERRRVDLLSLGAWPRQLAGVMLRICAQCCQCGFKMAITFQHLALIKVVERKRLGQRKDMLGTIIAIKRGFDRLD